MNIAYVLVQSTIGHEMEVLSDLLKIDFVKEAKGTFGYYDILVKIEASSEKEIERIITKKIRKVKNVNRTTTAFCNFRTRRTIIFDCISYLFIKNFVRVSGWYSIPCSSVQCFPKSAMTESRSPSQTKLQSNP